MTTVLFAASGSGGHLLPARYIAEALQKEFADQNRQLTVEFIGSGRPLEKKLIQDFGYVSHTVPIHGVASRGVRGIVQAIFEYPIAAYKVFNLLKEIKPSVIVGVGGYVSVLPVLIGKLLGIPSLIHEAEVRPGLATKALAFFATKITVAFADTKLGQQQKIVCTGHPLRPELKDVSHYAGQPRNVLILGGSQGSRVMDLEVSQVVAATVKIMEVKHQARPENLVSVKEIYAKASKKADVVTFFDDMVSAYSWADLMISRAGAGSVKELEFINKPAILVPLPSVGAHQLDNARSIERPNHIIVVTEGAQCAKDLRLAIDLLLTSNVDSQTAVKEGMETYGILPQYRIASLIAALTS